LDWTNIVGTFGAATLQAIDGIPMPPVSALDKVRGEYLQRVLLPGYCFSVLPLDDIPAPAVAPAAIVPVIDHAIVPSDPVIFHIIDSCTPQGRPNTVPGIIDPDEHALRSVASFLVRYMDVRSIDRTVPLANMTEVEVFADTDPVWMSWKDICAFASLRTRLTRWNEQCAGDRPGCVWLRLPVSPTAALALCDQSCPVLLFVEALYIKGWHARNCRVDHCHSSPDEKFFDAREALRQRHYYEVVLDLPALYSVCETIPSDEPISFYKCILAGHIVQARRGDLYYKHMLKHGVAMLPAIADDPGLDDAESGLFALCGGALPVPLPSARALRGVDTGGVVARPAALPAPVVLAPLLDLLPASAADVMVPEPVPLPDVDPVVAAPLPAGSSSDAVVAAPLPAVVGAAPRGRVGANARNWVPFPGGGQVAFDPLYMPPSGAAPYSTFHFKCHHHIGCEKKRTTGARNIARHGILEALAFLQVWRDVPVPAHARHVLLTSQVPRASVDLLFNTPDCVSELERVAGLLLVPGFA
jgi:hypothetical protein